MNVRTLFLFYIIMDIKKLEQVLNIMNIVLAFLFNSNRV